MSPIVKLLTRNLYEVFAETDTNKRGAAIAELYTDDCVFSDHYGRNVGHAALNEAVTGLHAKLPGYVMADRGPGRAVQDGGSIQWHFGPPEDPSRITGSDFIIVRGEKIAALYVFLDGPDPT